MKITIYEPTKNRMVNLEATPESIDKGLSWKIDFPDAPPLIVTQATGVWAAVGNPDINPELINRIGIALHPIARYTTFNS